MGIVWFLTKLHSILETVAILGASYTITHAEGASKSAINHANSIQNTQLNPRCFREQFGTDVFNVFVEEVDIFRLSSIMNNNWTTT